MQPKRLVLVDDSQERARAESDRAASDFDQDQIEAKARADRAHSRTIIIATCCAVAAVGVFAALIPKPKATVSAVPETVPSAVPVASVPSIALPAIPAATAPAKPAFPVWEYATTADPMTDAVTYMARILSTVPFELKFPYAQPQNAAIQVRTRGKTHEVMLSIERGQLMCAYECAVKVRFDDGKPYELSASPPSDHSSTTVFLGESEVTFARLSKAQVMRVEVTLFDNGSRVFEFRVTGLTQK